ncbi:amino acid adenylation domain-containing protein [Pseudoalteromonas sp. J010]|uniref:amino acid adenylation domain-containing protein n=1 Tax=Pseudoalteromonas sp. J010 TaxID=998465 RepID=UPI000F64CE57|nr:amino acid adenylation domain-containing protein [Pseudoalteromonas sp. J010]RRS07930.1 amino acid adenylation domain-containing protein [Pseudoalteromonas sp. J010]
MKNLNEVLLQGKSIAGEHKLAVHDGLLSMDYDELCEAVFHFAGHLERLGVRSGDRVGLWVDKSCRALAAMLAVTHIGAIYVPIDPANPIRRVEEIRKDCQLSILITSAEQLDQCTRDFSIQCQVIVLNEEYYGKAELISSLTCWNDAMQATRLSSPVKVNPQAVAYMLYTSGSTGTPKGVQITHENALAFIGWAKEKLTLSEQDRFANHAPWHFDLSVFDIYVSLLSGASVHLVSELLSYVPKQLIDFIEQQKITVWYSVPTALKLMLEAEPLFGERCERLTHVIFAGEAFEIKALKVLRAQLPDTRLYNFYGPTETNVCTYYEVGKHVPDLLPIGYPASNSIITIRNQQGDKLSQGLRGFICVSGPTVFAGYWGKTAQNSEYYNTGDLGYFNEFGELMYNGREDHMVKVKGYRIHLGEVEHALNQHKHVAECVVVLNEDKQLHAHITIKEKAPTLLELKMYCAKLLPKYMLIDRLQIWSQLPLTRNGKYARKALMAT